MMKIKKIIAFTAALALAVSLTACGGDGGSAEVETTTTTAAETVIEDLETTTAPETTTEETTTTEEVTEPTYQIPDWDNIDYADETDFTVEDTDGGVAIVKYNGTETVVKIPETIGGKTVVSLKAASVYQSPFNDSGVTDVKLPAGITKIDNSAFDSIKSLKSVSISEGVTVVDWCAFWSCENLESINIPEGVVEIGDMAFAGCKNLKNIVLPGSVAKIGLQTFRNCESLTKIDIPQSVTEMGSDAFLSCSKLTELIYPEKVKLYYNDEWNTLDGETMNGEVPILLDGCKSLKSIDIPEGVTFIGTTEFDVSSFGGCTSLETVTLPDSIANIDENAFKSCYFKITYKGTEYKASEPADLISAVNG
ncbi:MAG: leucine-rich repeat domain-containing protein [Muribaculaceae bacterium]|nr:leucine-rich repeat domain-containing protein [Muribaculaceae bacterium]